MPWLERDGLVLASLEVATTRRARRRGLMGRSGIDGALQLPRTRWVHTFGMRFPIDVAYLDEEGRVVSMATMAPSRLGRPRPSAASVVETRAGALSKWGVAVGDRITVHLGEGSGPARAAGES